ncbi:protein FLC EXPRESSOR isoform X2 [Capsicum annuum]|uniref:protein FLC EXPRESSOR isoform X2 n=1 Tax=Capsicum annuum TaxID=4072 RepID=UPI0007BF54ED|nr:protein FLC EXPRESSOR isoform X2 [Capsicum annuum]
MTRRKRRHVPYPTPLPDGDSRRRFPPPEAQSQTRIHPSVLIDDGEAAQEREIETLLLDNHRLAGAHVALKQELSAVQQELHQLSSTASTVKAERDAEVREIYEKALKKESDVRIVNELSLEMTRVRTDIQNLDADREELTAKLQEMEDDLVKVRLELQQFPLIKDEIEAMHKEVQRGRKEQVPSEIVDVCAIWLDTTIRNKIVAIMHQSRTSMMLMDIAMEKAAIDYEKKMHTSNLEYSQAMEKHKIAVTSEIEKLNAELANAEKRARAAAAAAAPSNLNHQFTAATQSFTYSATYGNPEPAYGRNLYPATYAVHQDVWKMIVSFVLLGR